MGDSPKLLIFYYSQSGNTEKMARAVEAGAKSVVGVDVELKYFAKPEEFAESDGIIFGTPTRHHNMCIEMQKLLNTIAAEEISLKGKIGATFGSYGWSGEAPTVLMKRLKNEFQMQTIEPAIVAKYTPDETVLEACRKLGRTVATKIMDTSN